MGSTFTINHGREKWLSIDKAVTIKIVLDGYEAPELFWSTWRRRDSDSTMLLERSLNL
jgi:hypothetical protein